MGKHDKTKAKILSGKSDANIRFDELCSCLDRLGFNCRQKGTSHKIYWHEDVEEIINIQSDANGKSKVYQVKQLREILESMEKKNEH
jgi:predicted RNA binding protein YcfA (HicA-like mRNA interferase family)